MKIGVSIPVGMSLRDAMDCAKRAEELGFDSVWANDSVAQDIFPMLTSISLSTEKIRLGSGVVNVFSRRPVTLALSAATVDEISNGRFLFGIGPSHKPVVEQRFDMKFEKTLQRMRESAEIIQKLVSGEALSYEGKVFKVKGYKMGFRPPRSKIPIYFGVMGPRMLELAGEIADGLYLTLSSPGFIGNAQKQAGSGMSKSGRARKNFEVALSITCGLTDRSDSSDIEAIRRGIAGSARLPSFNRVIAESGFPKEAQLISESWAKGDATAAARNVTDMLLKSVSLVGTADECLSRLEEYKREGLDLPVLTVPTAGEETKKKFLSMLNALAPK